MSQIGPTCWEALWWLSLRGASLWWISLRIVSFIRVSLCLVSEMPLWLSLLCVVSLCWHCAERHNAWCHYTECRYHEWHYENYHGAHSKRSICIKSKFTFFLPDHWVMALHPPPPNSPVTPPPPIYESRLVRKKTKIFYIRIHLKEIDELPVKNWPFSFVNLFYDT